MAEEVEEENMPLVARDKSTGERVSMCDYSDPRRDMIGMDLVCPYCGIKMIVVAGLVTVHHFRHASGECTCPYDSHPESQEHMLSKVVLAKNLGKWLPLFECAAVGIEVPVPEAHRIADLMYTFDDGWRIAVEVQLASITTESLEARTRDYALAGVDVYWFLGGKANTNTNRGWCDETQGFVFELEYEAMQSVSEVGRAQLQSSTGAEVHASIPNGKVVSG